MFTKLIDTVRQIRTLAGKLDHANLQLTRLHEDLRVASVLATGVMVENYIADTFRNDPRYSEPRRLNRHEFKVFSQNGEDGALSEIFKRIGLTNKLFVEFGVGNGLENNTAWLLTQGWSGAWFEASAEHARTIEQGFAQPIERGQLHFQTAAVTAQNIEQLFGNARVPPEFDLLSIDIDGNDYWVWSGIKMYQPRVVVIEYNAMFPAEQEWVMAYNPIHKWEGDAYFGASLRSLEMLGRSKGYSLVGCNFSGVNAFFVRNDLAKDLFLEPFTAGNHYEPARYFLIHRRPGHPRSYRFFQTPPVPVIHNECAP